MHVSASVSATSSFDEPDNVSHHISSTPVSGEARRESGDIGYRMALVKNTLPKTSTAGGNVNPGNEKFLPTKISLLRSHRRNLSLDVNVKMSSALTAKLDSQEYDIISDSELPSSLDHCSDEYLVVDGFIGQTVGSFTLPAAEENTGQDDPLFNVRLGLFEILQNVLVLLPDNLITRIFGTILKVEHLLVLVNQDSVKLREIAVKVCEGFNENGIHL